MLEFIHSSINTTTLRIQTKRTNKCSSSNMYGINGPSTGTFAPGFTRLQTDFQVVWLCTTVSLTVNAVLRRNWFHHRSENSVLWKYLLTVLRLFTPKPRSFYGLFTKKTRASAILELFLADGAMAKETGVQLEFTGNPITQHQEVSSSALQLCVSSSYFAVRSIWTFDWSRVGAIQKKKLGRGWRCLNRGGLRF